MRAFSWRLPKDQCWVVRSVSHMNYNPFPPHEGAHPSGLLCYGGSLSTELLLAAYRYGVFPWPDQTEELLWFSPPKRAVIFFDKFHVSQRLQRTMRSARLTTSWNTHTKEVIQRCATLHQEAGGTWITKEMQEAYGLLADEGYCVSMATLDGDILVGGVYGVLIDGVCSGESMFHTATDASKIALVAFVEKLKESSITWLDCQVINPLTKSFGATEITRKKFLTLLKGTHRPQVG